MSFGNVSFVNPSSSTNINDRYLCDETALVRELVDRFQFDAALSTQVEDLARRFVQDVRSKQQAQTSIKALIHQYSLSTQEGIVLMCLAEALLRIPDNETIDKLIHDKLSLADWESHIGKSHSWFVNASTWAMALTGKIVQAANEPIAGVLQIFENLVGRIGEPVVRTALKQGMRVLGQQFVMGATIDHALARSREHEKYLFSFDMLGEAALTLEDSERYYHAYANAIDAIGKSATQDGDIFLNPGISVKLSALHPRYEWFKREIVMRDLYPRLLTLAENAKQQNISMTIDAEESERLELSLIIFEKLKREPTLKSWNGVGLAVQAYQKRALSVIEFLAEIAKQTGTKIPLRLVKGAYWDSEIKRSQERGYLSYPVFTRKTYTDVSYLACAHMLLNQRELFYPQFATHNAHTIASIVCLAGESGDFEFQRLHGMGEELYDSVLTHSSRELRCRVYAPVGRYQDLLPYLVRRLLENGANTSFVHRIEDVNISVNEIVLDPFVQAKQDEGRPNDNIPLPRELFGESRANSNGLNFFDAAEIDKLFSRFKEFSTKSLKAGAIIDGATTTSDKKSITIPATDDELAQCSFASENDLSRALDVAEKGANEWRLEKPATRIECLQRAADLFERHREELIQLCVFEGGRSIPDALAEVREAIDYCRYYAEQAQKLLIDPVELPGPTGEQNRLYLAGRGIYACISPWNFPVAIFTGQVVAALVCGNAVIAKPASQTPLSAFRCVQLLLEAGIPKNVLQFVPVDAKTFNRVVLGDKRVAGVAFTGSTDTALSIQKRLNERGGAIASLIAETGGQNIMIADSSALPEQLVLDVVQSAFNSAGQRCSALRVLFVQRDIAETVLKLLQGYMSQLQIGEPWRLDVDVGPVISRAARDNLQNHLNEMAQLKRVVYQLSVSGKLHGYYFAPAVVRLDNLSQLKQEVFGPILHVIAFDGDDLDSVIRAVNETGYGLTLGIHSRIDHVVDYIVQRVHVGNIYVNRNMIGAVVGVQPFGGEGLSGTGPKAGGPYYLHRFCVERTVSINTAAAGGNVNLLRDDKL